MPATYDMNVAQSSRTRAREYVLVRPVNFRKQASLTILQFQVNLSRTTFLCEMRVVGSFVHIEERDCVACAYTILSK